MRALMKTKVSLGQSGIMVHHNDAEIALDPSSHADSHFTFVRRIIKVKYWHQKRPP
jgi:hypothetical protein